MKMTPTHYSRTRLFNTLRRRAVGAATLFFLALCSAWTAQAQVSSLNLRDFGALGDGVRDDGPALQSALDALANAGGGTLFVPAGRYAINTPVSKDFTGLASSITIMGLESSTPVDNTGAGDALSRGLDLVSEFFPRTGNTQIAIAISGLHDSLIKDIAFVGTPNVNTDALNTLRFDNVEKSTIRHCEFYGLSSLSVGGAIVTSIRGGLTIEQSKFLGCTANSGVYGPVVQNLQWKGIAVTDCTFVDYGQRPEFWGKLGLAAPVSWINIGNADALTNDSPRREVVIRNVFLDEGGFMGISALPGRYEPLSAPIDLVYISRLRLNVTNLGAYGNYLSSVEAVLIENSRYEWSHNADSAINIVNVRRAILDRLECLDSADRIRADAATGNLFVINSVYGSLASLAQTTQVINTQAEEDDPVQFVRQQYSARLGREPDATGHYYWSDLILRCGDDPQCIASTRAQLNAYLDSSPSSTFSITGQVTADDGVGLSGALITLTGAHVITTQTDANGHYSFSDLPTSGVYNLSVSKTHYTFSVPAITLTTPSTDQTIDFGGTLNWHTIAGRLTDGGGHAVRGVTITLSGSQDATTTTDVDGNYSFSARAAGSYTITPSPANYTCTPASIAVGNLSADQICSFIAQLNQGAPVLVSSPGSTRAIAVEAVLHTDEPFQLIYDNPWAADHRMRVMLFATNFELAAGESASAVTADIQDASGRIYVTTVEYVGKTPELGWLNSIVVRLPDDLGDAGDVLVRITYHGVASNRVRIGIGHVGGGPPDDAGAVPTPACGP